VKGGSREGPGKAAMVPRRPGGAAQLAGQNAASRYRSRGPRALASSGQGHPAGWQRPWGVPPRGTADLAACPRLQARLASHTSGALAAFIRQKPTRRDTIQPRTPRVQPTIQPITSVGRHTGSRSAILPGMAKRSKQTKQKNPAAIALGRLGGLRGRWKNIPPAQRSEAMRKAAQARWARKRRQKD